MEIVKKIVAKENDKYGQRPATVAYLGDSVTQGCFECYYKLNGNLETVFDPENSYSSKVQKMLHHLCPGAQINTVNGGISGDTAPGGLTRFDRDIAPFSPDLVVVAYALNDSSRGEAGLPAYTEALSAIFDRVRAMGAECIFLTPNLMNDRVSPHLPSEKMRSFAENFVKQADVLDKYVAAAKEVAAAHGVPVCDVYAKWKQMQAYGINVTELLSNKLNHPDREMHYVTALSLVETMLFA